MILFTDLDRTLLTHAYSIHSRVKEAFRMALDSELQIVFVTARAPTSLRPIATELSNLGVCACYNGAWIGSLSEDTPFSECRLPLNAARGIMQNAWDLGVEPIWYGDKGPEAIEITSSVLNQLHKIGEEPSLFSPDAQVIGPHKIMCMDRRPEAQLSAIAAQWSGEAEVAQSHKVLLEIGPKDISKGTAVRTLAQHLGTTPEQCAAAGDSYNDIPMLEAVGTAYTVENAVPEVKAIASFVAPSCDDGGLGIIISNILEDLRVIRRSQP